MVLKQYSQITHDDSKHKTSAKRDTASGVAGLDASGNILDTSGNIALTDDLRDAVNGVAGLDASGNILDTSGNIALTDNLRDAVNGVAGLDASGNILDTSGNTAVVKDGVGDVSITGALSSSGNITLDTANVLLSSGYGMRASSDNVAALTVCNIPLSGVDALEHALNLQIDQQSILQVKGTGDGSGSIDTSKNEVDITGDLNVSGDILGGNVLPASHGEMYIYNNSNATVIETADTPIALRQISEGLTDGFIFHAGSTGGITAYADYSGTVAGTVLVTDAGHGLSTGDIITIRGTTNYNGIFAITVVSVDTFYITDTWVNDNGASDWDQGASLTAQSGAGGVYTSTWQMTAAPAGACRAIFFININTTPQIKSGAPRELAINDEDNNSSTCLLEISDGDILWLSVQSDSIDDITHTYGNINIERTAA